MKRIWLLLTVCCLSLSAWAQGSEQSRKAEAVYASDQPDARLTGLVGLTAAYPQECKAGGIFLNGVIAEVTLTEAPENRIKSVTIDIDGIAGLALGEKIRKTYELDKRIYDDESLTARAILHLGELLAKGKRVSFVVANCGAPPVLTLDGIVESKPPSNEDGGFSGLFKGINKSEVTISNQTNRVVTIVMGKGRYRVGPKKSQLVTLEPGSYNYQASAPGLGAVTGSRTFERGYSYTWHFRTVTRTVKVPRRR